MSTIYKIVKVFGIAVVASGIITGGGAYVMLPKIMDHIETAERRSIAQYRRLTTEYKEADEELGTGLANNITNIRSVSQALISLRGTIEENNTAFILTIEEGRQQADDRISSLSEDYGRMTNVIANTDERIAAVISTIGVLNFEIDNLQNRQDELTLIQAGVTSVNKEDVDSAIESIGSCPTTVINRRDHLPSLRRAIQNTSSELAGAHEFVVWFDITKKGDTVLKDIESQTEDKTLLNAVQQYVDALVFEETNSTFANCEMMVKLNIN